MRRRSISICVILLALSGALSAVERRPIAEVDSDALIEDTQISPQGTGDDHVAVIWWIPVEFWQAMFARDPTASDDDTQAMLDALDGVSLLAVAQADISALGSFDFYPKDEVARTLSIRFTDAGGRTRTLVPMDAVNPDLRTVLAVFTPILGAAAGNLGSNIHFYVLDDRVDATTRRIDPYLSGDLEVRLMRRDGTPMAGSIPMPVNALYVPRKCPNGRDAHVSWRYCPWSGKRLPE